MTDRSELYEQIQEMIAQGVDLNAPLASNPDYTPLTLAIEEEDEESVRLLLENGADPNVSAGDEEGPPLYLAVVTEQKPVITMLLDAGADPSGEEPNEEFTPLMVASTYDLDIVKQLLDSGAFIDAKNKYGETALLVATREGKYYIVRELLRRGANPNTGNSYDTIPIYVAIDKFSEDEYSNFMHGAIMHLLTRDADLQFNGEYGNLGMNPLIYAIYKNSLDSVRFIGERILTQYGGDIPSFYNYQGMTPIEYAESLGYLTPQMEYALTVYQHDDDYIPEDEEEIDMGVVLRTLEGLQRLTSLCQTPSDPHRQTLIEIASYLSIPGDLSSMTQGQVCDAINEMVERVREDASSQVVNCTNPTDLFREPFETIPKSEVYAYNKNEKTGETYCLSKDDLEGMIERDRESRMDPDADVFTYTEPYTRLGDLREIPTTGGIPIIKEYLLRTAR